MKIKYLTFVSRIRNEEQEIERLVERTKKAWEKANNSSDELYIDSVALNLHGFYSSLEKIFELIANQIDDSIPEGSSWHQELLKQMTFDIKGLRPAVISENTAELLDEYRGFRHVVRNVYTFKLSFKKIKPLINSLDKVYSEFKREIDLFIKYIEENNT